MNASPPRPVALPVVPENIPEQLCARDHWVVWRYEFVKGKWTKVPYQCSGRKAATSRGGTWTSFANVWAAYDAGGWDGIGYVLTTADGIVGVDIDHCYTDGELTNDAIADVGLFNTYTESSPSGQGLRIFAEGTLDHLDGRKQGPREIYCTGRFLTITGHRLLYALETIEPRQEAIDTWHRRVFGEPKPKRERVAPTPATHLDDQELLSKARAAKNRIKIAGLYDTVPPDPDPRASEDDLALANCLAFYTKDPAQLTRLLEGSARRREKWYDPRGGSTWLDEYVVTPALRDVTETYSPPAEFEIPVFTPPRASEPAPTAGLCGSCPYADVAQQLAQLQAENAALRQALETERRQHHQVVQVHTGLVGALNNKHVKQEARTAFAVANYVSEQVTKGKASADGPTTVYLPALAETAACSDKQVSKHLDRLHEWGIVTKRTPTEVTVDEHGRRRRITRVTVEIPALAAGQGIAGVMQPLARFVPPDIASGERVSWGQHARCPDHPEARVMRRWADICEECGQVVDQGERVVSPAPAAPPTADHLDGRNFRPSADAVSGEVTSAQAAEPNDAPVHPPNSVEDVPEEEVSSVQEPAEPRPLTRCTTCRKPALPNGSPSCECSLGPVEPVADWPTLFVSATDEDEVLDEPPVPDLPPPVPIRADVFADVPACPRGHPLLMFEDQRTGVCSRCRAETPEAAAGGASW